MYLTNLQFVKSLQNKQIIDYLHAKGWKVLPFIDGKGDAWTLKNDPGEEFEILIPSTKTLKDYDLRIKEALETIAVSEKRSVKEVFKNIISFNSDILRIHFEGLETKDGKIPMENGVHLFEQTEKLLLSAACSAVSKKAIFASRKPNKALDYIKKVKFGQTEDGSYIVTVYSPIPSPNQTVITKDADKFFERKVLKTLAIAMETIDETSLEVLERGNFESFKKLESKGVSANLCEAITAMRSNDNTAKIDFNISWSSNFEEPSNIKSTFEFGPNNIPILEIVAKHLRETNPIDDFELEGHIIELKRPELEDGPGTAVIKSHTEDFEGKNIHLELNAEDYRTAIEAHKKYRIIKCVGRLEKTGRFWWLNDYHNFTAVEFMNT